MGTRLKFWQKLDKIVPLEELGSSSTLSAAIPVQQEPVHIECVCVCARARARVCVCVCTRA